MKYVCYKTSNIKYFVIILIVFILGSLIVNKIMWKIENI